MRKILFAGDLHAPYHDKKALKLVLSVGKKLKPDIVVLMGDIADFYAVSSHQKNPNRRRNLEYEVSQVNEIIDQFRALGASRNVFIAGNHEDRLERYLMDKAPELFNVVKIKELLHLSDWDYTLYRSHYRLGKLYCTHDVGVSGKNAAARALATYKGGNVVTGHSHRITYLVEGNAKGEAHVSASFGHLCDLSRVDYMHKVKAADWSKGFGIGYLLPNGNVHLQPIPIVNGSCVVAGELVR